jgi:hypothetical protein
MRIDTPFVAQGWQCPCCRRIYSPKTPMCFYCPPKAGAVTVTHLGLGQANATAQLLTEEQER